MAYRRRVAPRRKRVYRRKPMRRRRYPMYRKPVSILAPMSRAIKLRYYEEVTLTTGGVDHMDAYRFSAGSLFKPNMDSPGHQPRGFDQYALLYKQYCVIASKITVRFAVPGPSSTTNDADLVAGVLLNSTGDLIESVTNFTEHPRVRFSIVNGGPGANTKTFSIGYSAKRFHRVKNVLDNDNLSAAIGASPVLDPVYYVFIKSLNNLGAEICDTSITVDYIAVFTQPILPLGS